MSFSNRFTPQEITKNAKQTSLELAKEEEIDFLDSDRAIPGQNFVCMSFLSPETAVKERYLWFIKEFLNDLVKDVEKPPNVSTLQFKTKLHSIIQKKVSYRSIETLWQDFLFDNKETLSTRYDEENKFQTSTRGLKIRGTYNSYREAKNRSTEISKTDKNHNVYIGQVGYWLPWDPSPDEVSDQQYQEKELNTLMKGYRENKLSRDEFFYKRKEEKMNDALKKNKKTKLLQEKKKEKLNKVRKIVNKKDELFNKKKAEEKKEKKSEVVEETSPVVEETSPVVEETFLDVKTSPVVEETFLDVKTSTFGNSQLSTGDMSVFSLNDPWTQKNQ